MLNREIKQRAALFITATFTPMKAVTIWTRKKSYGCVEEQICGLGLLYLAVMEQMWRGLVRAAFRDIITVPNNTSTSALRYLKNPCLYGYCLRLASWTQIRVIPLFFMAMRVIDWSGRLGASSSRMTLWVSLVRLWAGAEKSCFISG